MSSDDLEWTPLCTHPSRRQTCAREAPRVSGPQGESRQVRVGLGHGAGSDQLKGRRVVRMWEPGEALRPPEDPGGGWRPLWGWGRHFG